jgi:hypothetical protein
MRLDIEQSTQWYIDILGFERRHKEMRDGIPTFVGIGKNRYRVVFISPGSTKS